MKDTSRLLWRTLALTVVAICLSVVIGGCDWFDGPAGSDVVGDEPEIEDDEPTLDLVPVIAFQALPPAGSVASTNVVPAEIGRYEAWYTFMGPLITGFRPNTAERGPGDTLTFPFMQTTINVDIARESGTFTFDGSLANGGGWLRMTYTPSSKVFTYEHALIVDDQHNAFGNHAGPDPENERFLYAAIYSVIEGIEMYPNGDFHGSYSAYVDATMRDDDGTIVEQVSQSMLNAEIYSGPMTLADETSFNGVGIATYMASVGDRLPELSGLPALTNIPLMKAALDDLSAGDLVEYPFLLIWNENADEFYDYAAHAERFGTTRAELEPLWDFHATEEDRLQFIDLLPTGGWQENTLQPALP